LTKTTTIVLADDHQVVREGLRLLLEARPGFSVVGEASDGLQAVELTERLQPDVLVADLIMPGLGGLDVTRRVTKRVPRTRVVILSMHSSDALVLEALRNGATAYVLKGFSAAELVQAIRDAVEGRRYLSPPLSEKALEVYVQKARPGEADVYETLTLREKQVLHMAAEGLSSSLTGERLGISPRTVETHRASVMRKLGLRSRADLIRYALQRGILPLDPPAAPGRASKP
jgi:DNA-binding NarL/FixJ family response regulator